MRNLFISSWFYQAWISLRRAIKFAYFCSKGKTNWSEENPYNQ